MAKNNVATRNHLLVGVACIGVVLLLITQAAVGKVPGDESGTDFRDPSATSGRILQSHSMAPTSIDDILLVGWVAEVSARGISDIARASIDDRAGSIQGGPEIFVAEFDVIQWLRVDEDGVELTKLVSASEIAPRSNIVVPLPARGIAVMMPYRIGPGLEEVINLSTAVAQKRSAETGDAIASAGWLVEWLPRASDGTFVFREGEDRISMEEIQLALEGKSRPARETLDRKAPAAPRMSEEERSIMRATLDARTAARRARITATQQAARAAVANSPYSVPFFWPSRVTGPMDQQAAVDESIARFIPGKRASVAFVRHMEASRALAVLGHSQEHSDQSKKPTDHAVWFVGIVAADGVTRREHAKFFEGKDISEGQGAVDDVEGVVGEYYIWRADDSSLIQMGGLTTGFQINSDIEIIQERLTE